MRFRRFSPVLLLAATLLTGASVEAATILANPSDRELNEGNVLQTSDTVATVRAGASASAPAGGRNALLAFQFPDFGAIANPFLTADFGLNLATLTGTPTYNADVYGLGLQSTATLALGGGVLATNRFYEANAVDPNATLIQQDFTTQATSSLGFKNTNATGDAALLAYLNSLYAGGAGANQFVVFRVNPDADLASATVGYNYSSADATGTATDPVITYGAVPEPSSIATLLGGSGLLALLRRRR